MKPPKPEPFFFNMAEKMFRHITLKPVKFGHVVMPDTSLFLTQVMLITLLLGICVLSTNPAIFIVHYFIAELELTH
jgi:hypothetical protein